MEWTGLVAAFHTLPLSPNSAGTPLQSAAGSVECMQFDALLALCKATGVLGKELTKTELQLIFVRGNINRVDDDDTNDKPDALLELQARSQCSSRPPTHRLSPSTLLITSFLTSLLTPHSSLLTSHIITSPHSASPHSSSIPLRSSSESLPAWRMRSLSISSHRTAGWRCRRISSSHDIWSRRSAKPLSSSPPDALLFPSSPPPYDLFSPSSSMPLPIHSLQGPHPPSRRLQPRDGEATGASMSVECVTCLPCCSTC